MAKDIRQRSIIKDIKSIDRAEVLKSKVRRAAVKAKNEAVEIGRDPGDASAETFAERKGEETARETLSSAAGGAVAYMRSEAGRNRHEARQDYHRQKGKGFHANQLAKTPESGQRPGVKNRSYSVGRGYTAQRGRENPTKSIRYYQHAEKEKAAAGNSLSSQMKRKTIRGHAVKAAAKEAQRKAAGNSVKAVSAAFLRALKRIIIALRGLILTISVGGIAAVIIAILIIVIAAILASALAVFFSDETGEEMTMAEGVTILSSEFGEHVEQIIEGNPHDELEIVYSDGRPVLNWKEIISVYAVKTAEDPDEPIPVLVLDEENLNRLRIAMNDMNEISYDLRTEERSRTTTEIKNGKEVEKTETYTVTILKIIVTKVTANETAKMYGFTKSQVETLAELMKPEYEDLWVKLIGSGAYISANGERREPSAERNPRGIFSWPLEIPGVITSYFGWRADPFTGVLKYHDGTDIATSAGTSILAAADGVVTVSNATDSYGGGWGYYVKISHGGGFDTLYAHCSAVAVRSGEAVSKGQIIAYVGSTGRSTGDHLHWEVYLGGSRVDALAYFE